jgi:IS5 family transposase
MRVELDKSLRETEAWFNDSSAILDEFGLERAPHYSSFCRWEQKFQMRELRRLLRALAEQAGWSGEAAIDASGFPRQFPIRVFKSVSEIRLLASLFITIS